MLSRQMLTPMRSGPHSVAPALAGHALAEPAAVGGGLLGPMVEWLESGILWMGANPVPKKRNSYTRKRTRQSGRIQATGPKAKSHLYMCPVCERMRAPHRVCDREDCQTYFRHRWF